MKEKHRRLSIKFNFLSVVILIVVSSLLDPVFARAQYYSQNDSKKIITVDKKIKIVKENLVYDDIPSSKYVFVEGDIIEFEVVVTNAGNEDLVDVKLSDNLPQYLSLVFSPGYLTKQSNIIEWSLDKLSAGESRKYVIRAKISGVESANRIQAIKLTNKVFAVSGQASDKDYATYFVAKKVVPITGNGSLPIKTAALVSLGGFALYFRKLARGY